MPNENILVIDDEKELTSTLEYFFSKEGHSVAIALSGEEAVKKLESKGIDLVILDMKMKGLDGPGVLEIINEKYPKTKVVILTGYGEQYEEKVKGLKYDAFMAKPFSPNTIVETAKDVLEGRRIIKKEEIPIYNDPYIMPKAKLLFIDLALNYFVPKNIYFESKEKCGGEYSMQMLFVGVKTFDSSKIGGVEEDIKKELHNFRPDIVLGNQIVLGAKSEIYKAITKSDDKPKDIIVYSNKPEDEKTEGINLSNLPPAVDVRLDKLGRLVRDTAIKNNLYFKTDKAVRIPALGLKYKASPKPPEEKKKEITKEDIPDVARKIIAEQLGISKDLIHDNAHLVKDLGVDSLASIEIAMTFEEELGIDIPDEDADRLYKFKQVVDYLQRKFVQEKKKEK